MCEYKTYIILYYFTDKIVVLNLKYLAEYN